VKLRYLLTLICTAAAALAQADNTLTAEEVAAGWKLLFDGKTITGLRGVQKAEPLKTGWKIADGELSVPKDVTEMGKVTGGDLMTVEAFTDFEFRFDFKFGVSTNAGIRYLVRGGLGGPPMGCEYQIIDDVHHPEGLKGGPIRRTGALDTILPPAETKQLNEAERWNHGRIIVQGNHVEHWLNGQKVLEYDLGSRALLDAVKAAKVKVPPGFGTKVRSPVVLLDQGDQIAFRNLKIRPLPPRGTATPAAATPIARPATPVPPTRPTLPATTPIARPAQPAATPVARPATPAATPRPSRPPRPLSPPTLE
jgi:hypothetical protein